VREHGVCPELEPLAVLVVLKHADNHTGKAAIKGNALRPGQNALHNKVVC
jgi:hypothetical protein